jgi:hypothetical protein
VSYGAFIVPGLIMLMLLTQSVANASFGIYFPKFVGTIYELLSAPISYVEILLGYVGAAATKSLILGLIVLATAGLFVPLQSRTRVDAGLPGAHGGVVQPVRLHHRHGRTASRSCRSFRCHHHAADLSRRQLLLALQAAAVLADGDDVQSVGVLISGSLELHGVADVSVGVSCCDAGVPRAVPGNRVVDFQDGLPAEELS